MKLNEIYTIADGIAPKALSDEMCRNYGAYDNSGILVDTGEEVHGVLFTLDLSFGAIEKALETGANLIITHHPAIYGKISNVCADSGTLGAKLVKCIRNGISVIAMHLNLDVAKGGIDECLMQGIKLAAGEKDGAGTDLIASQLQFTQGGAYGRVYEVSSVALATLAENMKEIFSTKRIEVYGDGEKTVGRVASFCGAGADEDAIEFAVRNGAEVMVSSDFKHHLLAMAMERNLAVVTLTHYASEQYGFKEYYKKIRRQLEIPCYYHTDDMLF